MRSVSGSASRASIAISVVIWFFDGIRVFFVAHAMGADLAFSLAVFVALMAALLTTLPFTPAGLGVVEVVAADGRVLGQDAQVVAVDRGVAARRPRLVGAVDEPPAGVEPADFLSARYFNLHVQLHPRRRPADSRRQRTPRIGR